jgi:hypothetical protein
MRKLTIIRSLDEIPERFESEDAEREWWATHDLSEELYNSLEDITHELDEIAPIPEAESIKKRRKAS